MVSTEHGLFVGVANPFSPEVAVRRTVGWNYEENQNGGLEIWLGSRHAGQEETGELKPSAYISGISGGKKHLPCCRSEPGEKV